MTFANEGGGGGLNLSKLPTDSSKDLPIWGRGVSKIREIIVNVVYGRSLSTYKNISSRIFTTLLALSSDLYLICLPVAFPNFFLSNLATSRGVNKGGGGQLPPLDFGRIEGATGQRQRATLLLAPQF